MTSIKMSALSHTAGDRPVRRFSSTLVFEPIQGQDKITLTKTRLDVPIYKTES